MRSITWTAGSIRFVSMVLGSLAWLVAARAVAQQQVTVSTPYHSVSDGYYENMGTHWGLHGPNWNLRVFGSPMQAAPPFGGFDPSAGANFGFHGGGNGWQGHFGANFSQGSRRSFVSQAPSLTLQNGTFGSMTDTTISPFVTGYIPVVGGFPVVQPFMSPPVQAPFVPYGIVAGPDGNVNENPAVRHADEWAKREQQQQAKREQQQDPPNAIQNPPAEQPAVSQASSEDTSDVEGPLDDASRRLAAARFSSAGQPAMSVAEARRLHQAERTGQTDKVLGYIERARAAEAAGKTNVAKLYYEMALRRATDPLRGEIQARLRTLDEGHVR